MSSGIHFEFILINFNYFAFGQILQKLIGNKVCAGLLGWKKGIGTGQCGVDKQRTAGNSGMDKLRTIREVLGC